MVDFCREHNMKLLCYGTVAGGFLSQQYVGVPEPKEPFENRSLVKYKLIIDDFGGWELFQELLVALSTIATKYNASITNVATRYVLEKSQVAGIIIGGYDTSFLRDNLKVFEFHLDEEDRDMIQKILGKSIGPQGDTYSLERIKGGKHASIMRYNLNKS
jgi:aryl-alcohol dehydrogenase-like predicted oxidoreductase